MNSFIVMEAVTNSMWDSDEDKSSDDDFGGGREGTVAKM